MVGTWYKELRIERLCPKDKTWKNMPLTENIKFDEIQSKIFPTIPVFK